MIDAAHLDSLYKAARIVLWVEDTLTRDYLRAAWGNTPDVAFYVAGGNEHIPRLVTAARQLPTPIGHVFGVLDRDFGRTNRPSWATADNFKLPRHEMENYLLDKDALSGIVPFNNRGRSIADIDTEMQRLAARQPAWLACRHAIQHLRGQALQDFPSSPGVVHVPDVPAAINRIVSSTWYTQVIGRLNAAVTTAEVTNQINGAFGQYQADLTSGVWVESFSGKEIFRELRSYVYQPQHNPGEPDNDVAKAIGAWQLANNRVPQDITDLLSALRTRVGLTP
jgi:hypothetical protein